MAKRKPFSKATGVIKLTSQLTLPQGVEMVMPGDNVSCEVKLRPIAGEKRRVPPTFFLRQHVRFRLELRVRRDAPGL